MAAESALHHHHHHHHHHDAVKHPVEQLQDLPLYGRPSSTSTASSTSSSSSRTSATKNGTTRFSSEKTPLVIKTSGITRKQTREEEVHPLPWFRSPEWSRKSPVRQDFSKNNSKRSYRRGRGESSSLANANSRDGSTWWCFGASTKSRRHEDDLEIGYSRRTGVLTHTAADDAGGFRQCIQFLVGLIIVVALALIFMIIFQPFHENPSNGW
ncbi:hypothetical protein FI667_g10689, partial [Globisporangium splendens]